jgi:hypothetical protein
MIHRIRRSLPWFGAVAAVLLFALPVQADDIEPEPYVEEEVVEPEPVVEAEAEVEEEAEPEIAEEPRRNIEMAIDAVIVRPLYIARLVVGLPFFVFYPLTLASGYDEDALALLWTEPFDATFRRPLGATPDDY